MIPKNSIFSFLDGTGDNATVGRKRKKTRYMKLNNKESKIMFLTIPILASFVLCKQPLMRIFSTGFARFERPTPL